MEETWKAICGYEDSYEISSHGRVRSLDRKRPCAKGGAYFKITGKILKEKYHQFGYPYITLSREGKKKHHLIHTLVLEAFVCKRPEGMVCCHGDGNPKNSMLDNLRWGTPLDNAKDTVIHGNSNRGTRCHFHTLTEKQVIEIRKAKGVQSVIAERYGINHVTVWAIKNYKTWKHLP